MLANRITTGSRRALRGFTLIELMIVLVIIIVLTLVAVPNFSSTVKRNRVESTTREVAGALSLARTEAASRGVPVVLCRSTNVTATTPTCSTTTGATEGWLIFEDSDRGASTASPDLDNNEPILRVHDSLTSTRLAVTDTAGTAVSWVIFDRNGFSNARLTFEVCDSTRDTTYARGVLMENSGRVAHARYNTGTGLYQDINGNNLTCP